jgi:molybdate transport system substrate-binding protein
VASLWLLAVWGCGVGEAPGAGPAVFAAASLSDLAGDLARAFERRESVSVDLNLAASNTLAQQILAAPGADVFLSADLHWVEVLESAGRVVAGSRRPLLANRLVLIARNDAEVRIGHPAELADAAYRFLALADPEAVPAGRYARAALEAVPLDGGTLWSSVAGRVAPALDVRAALALVESDREILGIVYRTDALSSTRVRVAHEFPRRDGAEVTYYGVLVEGGGQPDVGGRFLAFLATAEARAIAQRHGFEAVAR